MTRLRLDQYEGDNTRPDGIDAGAVVTVLRVPPECSGMRLDRFIQTQLKRTSRTRTQVIIENSAFSPGGKPLRPGARVRAEQHVFLWRPPWDEATVEAPIAVVFEDAHFLVVSKPPHVPVHPTARYFKSTLVKLLEVARPDERLFLAHRLDRETSGTILLTKTKEADRFVKRQFAGLDPWTGRPSDERFVEKTYQAIAHGVPDWTERAFTEPLEPDPKSSLRVKMRVADGDGLTAKTVAKVVGAKRSSVTGERFSLIECELFTGRQHQIRVHLAHAGFSLVGDKLYGKDDNLHRRSSDGELTSADLAALLLPRHALHARRLSFLNLEGVRVTAEAELPPDLRVFWQSIDA